MKNKELILDWIGDLNDLVGSIGPWLTIIIFLIILIICMIILFTKHMKNLSNSIDRLADKVSSPYEESEESLIIFRAIMRDHIWMKLEYLGDILEHNHIDEREPQIKKNIEREFMRITIMEAEKLSKFKSICGDMGKILKENINWKEFLISVFDIFFSSDEFQKKIDDIHGIMNEYVDKIATIIEENGIHNRG